MNSLCFLLYSTDKPLSSPAPSSGSKESQIQPIKRPDRGGTVSIRSIDLVVNHFPVAFDKQGTIFHYNVDVKFLPSNGGAPLKKALRKSELRFIKDLLFPGDELLRTAYDGEKNIFSAIRLPEGQITANVPEGEDVKSGSYSVAIKLVNELKLSKLHDYLRGNLSCIPRDTLQGMDLVMKENPFRTRIIVGNGRGFYKWREELGGGLAAYKSLNQSLKPTLQGLSLCLDYSILAMRKPLPVLDFLKEHIPGFRGADDVKRLRKEVERALQGLKVTVTHRRTKQKYTIARLNPKDACETSFELIDPEGVNPPRRTALLDYFRNKWGKEVTYQNIPCLDLARNPDNPNSVPMEYCVLVEGQVYSKDELDKDTALFLKRLTLAKPWDRREAINTMVRAEDGPNGYVILISFLSFQYCLTCLLHLLYILYIFYLLLYISTLNTSYWHTYSL